jgi:subtilisin family serine protease
MISFRKSWPIVCLLLVSGTSFAAPVTKYYSAGDDRIPNEYIIVLADDIPAEDMEATIGALHRLNAFDLHRSWKEAIKGFSAHMPEAVARALSNSPFVKYVEENATWHLSSGPVQTNINPVTCDPTVTTCSGSGIVTDNRLWHLDRADQNYPDPTLSYSYCTTGSNVTVYVVDTGVNKNHQEFGNRVMPGYNATGTTTTNDHMPADDPCLGFADPGPGYVPDNANYVQETINNGHGTAVASAVAGRRVGIAKNATIVPIKVARCDVASSRARISSHPYVLNKNIYLSCGGNSIDAIYRAVAVTGSGLTAATEPSGFRTPGCPSPAIGSTIQDGGIQWQRLDPAEYAPTFAQTTDYFIDGLNWIRSSANPNPKSFAIVSLSTYRRATDISGTNPSVSIESVIRTLLGDNITVIASANNQNGDACDTSPSRMSATDGVITAGGSMLVNRPWSVNLSEPPAVPDGAVEADGGGAFPENIKGREPSYLASKSIREGRWICGPGDSTPCNNTSPTQTISPTNAVGYYNFAGGSNAGPCVTLFAPAKNLFLAAVTGSGSDYRDPRIRGAFGSGTSFAAPIVAGFAARLMEGSQNTLTPALMRAALLSNCSSIVDSDNTLNSYNSSGVQLTGTPNKFLRLADVNFTQQQASTKAAGAGPTTLTVFAGGTTTVSYQWYEVNTSFDLVTYKSGAHSSTLIAGATTNTYAAPASSTVKGYWVRATNSCGSADSDIAVVVPNPGPPANVIAVPTGTSVTVTWSTGAGAEKYEILRKVSGQPWTRAALVNNSQSSFTEIPTAPNGMVAYRVRSVAGIAYLQDPNYAYSIASSGDTDFANLNFSAYEAVTPGVTPVRAQHLIELRQATNALCDTIGVPQEYLASEVLLASLQGSTIRAADYTSLLTHANHVRTTSLGLAAASFSTTTPGIGNVISRQHLLDLREALRH